MNRSLVIVALTATLGLAACTTTPQADSSPSTPTTPSAPSATAPSVVTEVVTATVTNPPKPPGKTMIDSFGFGALKLGMTREQAIATGLIGPDKGIQARYCTAHDILGTDQSLTISNTRGIASITFSKDLQQQGAGVGGTRKNVQAAHPNLKAQPEVPGDYRAEASGNPDAHFSFYIGEQDDVRSARLVRNEQDCVAP